MGSAGRSPNIWAPYDTTKDCSLGICSIYCPQWCYIIVPPPPDFGLPDEDDDHDSGTNFSPLIIAIIGILACVFILLTYYTLISKYCRRRRHSGGGGSDGRGIEIEENRDPMNPGSWQQANSTGLDETLIKSITVFKYNKNDKLIEGTDCSVCLSEFQENENLRLLPMCTHAFHLPCIDTWLKSNSSCPLCRSNMNSISVPSNPVAPQQVQPMPNQQTQQNQLNISRFEYQHRNNESTVLVIVQDSELGTQESVFNLSSENVPKTPNEESREREVNDDDQAVRANGFQPIRRSISFNSSLCQRPVLVSDILSASEEDEDMMIHVENLVQLSRGIGSSKGGGEVIEEQQHCKNNDTSGAFNLVRSHLSMKRSISTGRFVFTRHGKGNNSILPK